jgi:hypothetical protein
MGKGFNTTRLNSNWQVLDLETPSGKTAVKESVRQVRALAKKAYEAQATMDRKARLKMERDAKAAKEIDVLEILEPFIDKNCNLKSDYKEIANFIGVLDTLREKYNMKPSEIK